MGTVVVKCVVTGLDFAVGIETDEYSFNSLPDIRLKARCPHCGVDHDWSPRHARLRTNLIIRTSRATDCTGETLPRG